MNIRRQTLPDVVHQRLRHAILTGVYRAHDRLPTEHDLVEKFRVSRPVVREALNRLREDGLIQSRRGSGSFVLAISYETKINFGNLENQNDLRSCYEFRIMVEPLSARLAAARATSEHLDIIGRAMEAEHAATTSSSPLAQADLDFHLAVASASGNQYFISALAALRDHVALGIHLYRTAVQWATPELNMVYDEHKAILAAIEARDADRAAKAMINHLQRGRDVILCYSESGL